VPETIWTALRPNNGIFPTKDPTAYAVTQEIAGFSFIEDGAEY